MKKTLLLSLLLISSLVLTAQNYRYNTNDMEGNLNAYWYAIPTDSITWLNKGNTDPFFSIAHVYGKKPEGDFTISVKAFDKGKIFFNKEIAIVNGKAADKDIKLKSSPNGFFRIEFPTNAGMRKPDKIEVQLKSGKSTYNKTIVCKYHTISGQMTDFDGKPFKGIFGVAADDFKLSTCIWTDDKGNYSITLPERTYNTFFADDQTYAVSTLEYWGWRMIVDRDEVINIKIGNGEVYNLHAWANNGGGSAYFLYFRPMVLPLALLPEKETSSEITIGTNKGAYNNLNISPELSAEDITVELNGEKLPVISVQTVYETTKDRDSSLLSMNAYIVQVEQPRAATAKKLTFTLSYDTHVTVNGEKIRVNAMGNYQLYTNFTGLSEN